MVCLGNNYNQHCGRTHYVSGDGRLFCSFNLLTAAGNESNCDRHKTLFPGSPLIQEEVSTGCYNTDGYFNNRYILFIKIGSSGAPAGTGSLKMHNVHRIVDE